MSPLVPEVVIRFRLLIAAAAVALIIVPCSSGASVRQLHAREHRQVRSLWAKSHTLIFFRRHPRLARTKPGRRALRVARVWVPIIRRELAETRAQLQPTVPQLWIADAICETGKNPPNWRFHVGVYQGGIAFYWATWDSWKQHVSAARGYADADQAPAWVQAAVASWGLKNVGRWGCLNHPSVSRYG